MKFKLKLVLFIIKQGILLSCWTQYVIILVYDSIEEYPWELHFWDPVIEIESNFEMHSKAAEEMPRRMTVCGKHSFFRDWVKDTEVICL